MEHGSWTDKLFALGGITVLGGLAALYLSNWGKDETEPLAPPRVQIRQLQDLTPPAS